VSVCSLDKLASIDIPAARNIRIFGLQADTATVLAVKVRVLVWNRHIQPIANIRVATWNRVFCCLFRSYLPQELWYLTSEGANPEMRSIASLQILAFLLGTSSFYPYKFSCTEL